MHGCRSDGTIDDSDFSNPLPWIGVYVALFSLVCAVLMGFDLAEGFRRRRHWFPCRAFSLNATTLTLLGIAAKLPADINTAMPGRWDQLSKLTGAVLVCTAMGNIMPSLGVTDNIFSNTVALAILVITVVGNITTQLTTGVIYSFHLEHYIVLSFMLILLAITISSALIVSTTKEDLKMEKERNSDQKLEMTVDEYWLMAHTSSPQYVLGRSAALSLGSVCRPFVQEFRNFCARESDYEWSSVVVSISQMVTISVGTVAPAWRCLSAIGFRGRQIGCTSISNILMLKERIESRLKPWINRRWFRKSGRTLSNSGLWLLIVTQAVVVVFCKVVALFSLLVGLGLGNLCLMMRRLGTRLSSARSVCFVDEETPIPDQGKEEVLGAILRGFVLHLEGEDQFVELIMKSGRRDSEKSIQEGRDRPPVQLRKLIRKYSSEGFPKIGRCGIRQMSPNCWALPLVTLASIALAIPGIDRTKLKALRRGVDERLRYVRLVDKHLDIYGLVNAAEAADILWDQVDLFGRLFDTKLCRLSGRGDHVATEEILRILDNVGILEEIRGGQENGTEPVNWPPRVLAGMLTAEMSPVALFRWLCEAIADLLGACLINIPKVVWMECICSSTEKREERVEEAALLVGESQELLEFLNQHRAKGYPPQELWGRVNEWASR
ncbi:unnamed protein product [Spirodela intermedia]|uniref:Uncharacterized protein n=1 Tax=Spirodela intermedia TaxID=51605 RepID=A0A7I8K3S5_SPIIN|nr:unnamed protein product [Spirodela intermedia]